MEKALSDGTKWKHVGLSAVLENDRPNRFLVVQLLKTRSGASGQSVSSQPRWLKNPVPLRKLVLNGGKVINTHFTSCYWAGSFTSRSR